MYQDIEQEIRNLNTETISQERKKVLEPLIAFIQSKLNSNKVINLNFICTHNSRRSHLSQIWAQVMAAEYDINNVFCYSGGTEATAMFPVVGETLITQGFEIDKLSETNNPVYSIKYDNERPSIVVFSKVFDAQFNPRTNFAAVMTCSHADENCPFIPGAEQRIPVRYEDPKAFDNTPQQAEKYKERSIQIATEMKYVFSKITK
ncbi:MAG: protein-tyrosine-phosphatase [Winogradskyella sp.]|uniref:arsenate-mycothiol transferase ArsC n=1 Tax=Winogradskyella sp. TaxID=1883156 RepID=UPI000F4055AE|nr:protein-tyrosine-phosphatase [Winogradskyella sp.]RNC86476.1 MAG: protein-tyrosine-phosphatase [Winogradskyella sp.]